MKYKFRYIGILVNPSGAVVGIFLENKDKTRTGDAKACKVIGSHAIDLVEYVNQCRQRGMSKNDKNDNISYVSTK